MPVHARRLFGQVIAGVWIVRVQSLHDLEHRPCGPVLLRFPLREIAQPMAPPAGNPPSPIENTASPVTAWAAEPKSQAADVRTHPRLLNEVHGRDGNLTIAALKSDLQLVVSRECWLVAPQRCEIDTAHGFCQRTPTDTPHA